jgi:NDP-sugar pyrophosphorylase family protein/aminoglycoside/choline kinase family phosphotransferase
MTMKALILAAGLGTRLRPYTDHRPKALFTINQRPMLARAIDALHRSGFGAVWVNAHHLHDQIENYVAETRFLIPVTVFREVDILGTGGALRNVAGHWKSGPLLIINADVLSDIDPAQVISFHQSHDHPVTMVMHDRAEFNSVCVDVNDFVTGFKRKERHGERLMAFTGIHVVDRKVLEFLPPRGAAHIIDAYARMLDAGERIKARVVTNHYWQDIGTPERYRAAVFDQMAPCAFEAAFGARPQGPIIQRQLHGDGSDRQWYRIESGSRTLIMADHGIRQGGGWQEVDAYVRIGQHLHAQGVAVPRIHLHDGCSGLVFVEDIGDVHLQSLVQQSDGAGREQLYRQVIDRWLTMAMEGRRDFDPLWTYQSTHYDRQIILERECRYFVEAFVQNFLGWTWTYDDFETEFERLARRIDQTRIPGFLHRDFQSRNIMVQNRLIVFIDFQGGRLGPIQYDLASLLIDPYTALPAAVQQQLLAYGAARLNSRFGADLEKFKEGYELCAVARNLQILGAFAYLSRVKGKQKFEAYIPTAVDSLVRNVARAPADLPRLSDAARRIQAHLAAQHDRK